jgi:peroxiredoxin family protein
MDPNKKTLIVFSGDLDRAIAAFILANGAAAMGNEVTMFFTFWGLNIIRRPEKVTVTAKRTRLQAVFAAVLPRGPDRLGLSKLNLAGLGPLLMKRVMKSANISSLGELIEIAREQEIRMVACTTSMEVLGLTKDDLLEGVELAGVASYFDYADDANVNLLV